MPPGALGPGADDQIRIAAGLPLSFTQAAALPLTSITVEALADFDSLTRKE